MMNKVKMILNENDPLADRAIFDSRYAVSNDKEMAKPLTDKEMRATNSQNIQQPNLYPSQESSQQDIIYDRSVSQTPTTTTPTTTDEDFSFSNSISDTYTTTNRSFLHWMDKYERFWELKERERERLKNYKDNPLPRKQKRVKVIHSHTLDDELLKAYQLKKHQRDIRINNNYQPVKKDSTEYTLEERFKKYPYIRYQYITEHS